MDLVNYKLAMGKKLKEQFKVDMNIFNQEFGQLLHIWSDKISFVDFINSGAICAHTNHYSKPLIVDKQSSFVKTKELRHPIVEQISTDTEYVPHDIEMGYETEQNGILLYGINSSGNTIEDIFNAEKERCGVKIHCHKVIFLTFQGEM